MMHFPALNTKGHCVFNRDKEIDVLHKSNVQEGPDNEDFVNDGVSQNL